MWRSRRRNTMTIGDIIGEFNRRRRWRARYRDFRARMDNDMVYLANFGSASMTTKLFAAACIAASTALFAAAASAQRDFSDVEITTEQVADGLYMLQGAGGNIGLSVGEDGAFVIDDQYAPLSDKILAAIAAVTDKPVAFVINTHYHGDHTGGNEAFGEAGAHIVAHDNVRKRLAEGVETFFGATEPAAAGALPVITFSETVTFHWNDEEIYVFHPDRAHTDGDAIVHFRNANVVHMGDILFVGMFPYIDYGAGGDIGGYIDALEQVAGVIDEDTKVIPGHGPLADKSDILASAAMLKEVRARIQATIDAGLDEDAAVAAAPLADLAEDWGGGFINAERMTRKLHRGMSR